MPKTERLESKAVEDRKALALEIKAASPKSVSDLWALVRKIAKIVGLE